MYIYILYLYYFHIIYCDWAFTVFFDTWDDINPQKSEFAELEHHQTTPCFYRTHLTLIFNNTKLELKETDVKET